MVVPIRKPSQDPTQKRQSAKPTVSKSMGVSPSEPDPDIRLSGHPQFKRFQELRVKVANALANRSYIRDFNRHYVPTTTVCPTTFSKLTGMLAKRDHVEHQLENLLDDVDQDGLPLDPRRDIESTYEELGSQVDEFNRAMFTEYVKFLTVPRPPTPDQLAAIFADVDQRVCPNPGIIQVVDSSPAAAPSPALLE